MTGRGALAGTLSIVTIAAASPFFVAGRARGYEADVDTCVRCHAEEEDDELRLPVPEWRESVHARAEVSCDACHGGDPREPDGDLSMSEEAGFLDTPSWTEMADYCGVCHEAIAKSYSAGFFGQHLLAGTRVPSCATCHMAGSHRILESQPEEVFTQKRCPGCLPMREPETARHALAQMRELEAAIGDFVEIVEERGIDLTDVRAELGEARAEYAQAIHEFVPEAIGVYTSLTVSQLSVLSSTIAAYGAQAVERRRYGFLMLALLAILFGALLRYRMTLR